MNVLPLSVETLPLLEALFDDVGLGCFCRYWHFEGSKNDWLARLAQSPGTNRDELRTHVSCGSDEGEALVAVADGRAVGFLKLARPRALQKLRRQGAYKLLDLGPEDDTYYVGCFLVHPAHRKKGVARELLAGAMPYARARGALRLIAFPRRSSSALYDEEAWGGPEAIFSSVGFALMHDSPAYPVYVRSLVEVPPVATS
jgi:GNAT superfamily N-acetyltransferase